MAEIKTKIDLFEKARNHDRVEQIRFAEEHDVMPYFRVQQSIAGPQVMMEDKMRIMLGGNNYLGFVDDDRVLSAAREALDRYGTALTGSRLLNGTSSLHVELEKEVAEWTSKEDAIVFTTGYQANLGCIGTLLGRSNTVICDSAGHASIVDGCKMSGARIRSFKHNNMDKLKKKLEHTNGDGGVLVVVDGVFSMRGDICDLSSVVELCQSAGARLMVDEAHAVGVLGPTGAGTAELFDLQDEVDIIMGTFSKALASCGGYIAGPTEVIDYLRIASRPFLFTASSVPAAVGAALEAVRICRSPAGQELFDRVQDNARYMHARLKALGLKLVQPTKVPGTGEVLSPIVPIVVGDDIQAVMLWKALYDEGLYTNVALYPAVPRGGALLRTSVMATHERKHLDSAIEIIDKVTSGFSDLSV